MGWQWLNPMQIICNMVRCTWCDWSLSLGLLLSSVLWHCWLGHLTRKNPSLIWPIMCLVGCWTLLNQSRTTRVSRHQKVEWSKRWWVGSGISWTICKSFAPRSRQITTPVPHQCFTGRMLFLTPNQQCQSTDGNFVSDIAVFVLKRDDKLQLTN